jgi:hypothetical protein
MSERSDLADWLKAIQALKPEGDDLLESIAALLGLRIKGAAKAAVATAPKRKAIDQTPEGNTALKSDQPIPDSKSRRRLVSVLTPGNASRNPAPAWLTAAGYLETTGFAHIRPAIPLEPLFPARTSRAILSSALATPSSTGSLNVEKLIELVSRAQVIEEIPRLPIPTLVWGVQLLIDCSEAMQPFVRDQDILRSALSSVVGRDRTEVSYFDKLPLWGAGTGPKDEWADYSPPAHGTPVVVLTDLGIAQPPGVAGLASLSDWSEFSEMLARAGCPLMALVPYPPKRWPMPLTKTMAIVQWDRATTASVIRRRIPAGLRVLKRA